MVAEIAAAWLATPTQHAQDDQAETTVHQLPVCVALQDPQAARGHGSSTGAPALPRLPPCPGTIPPAQPSQPPAAGGCIHRSGRHTQSLSCTACEVARVAAVSVRQVIP